MREVAKRSASWATVRSGRTSGTTWSIGEVRHPARGEVAGDVPGPLLGLAPRAEAPAVPDPRAAAAEPVADHMADVASPRHGHRPKDSLDRPVSHPQLLAEVLLVDESGQISGVLWVVAHPPQ